MVCCTVKLQIHPVCTFVFRCLFIYVMMCLLVCEGEGKKERERRWGGCSSGGGGGGLTSRDEIKRLTYTFDLKNSFRAEHHKLHIVTPRSRDGCYTCQTNLMQICTAFAFTVMLTVCVCLEGETALWAKSAILASGGSRPAFRYLLPSFIYHGYIERSMCKRSWSNRPRNA